VVRSKLIEVIVQTWINAYAQGCQMMANITVFRKICQFFLAIFFNAKYLPFLKY